MLAGQALPASNSGELPKPRCRGLQKQTTLFPVSLREIGIDMNSTIAIKLPPSQPGARTRSADGEVLLEDFAQFPWCRHRLQVGCSRCHRHASRRLRQSSGSRQSYVWLFATTDDAKRCDLKRFPLSPAMTRDGSTCIGVCKPTAYRVGTAPADLKGQHARHAHLSGKLT